MTATALRALSSMVRAGLSLRTALLRWPETQPDLEEVLRPISQAILLGAPAVEALGCVGGSADITALVSVIDTHRTCGGDLPAMIDSLAEEVEERGRHAEEAAAAVAGMRLSARLVAALPVVFLFMPMARDGAHGSPGVALLLLGLALVGAGLAWMSKLVPVPRASIDPARLTALTIGSAVKGGCSFQAVLDSISKRATGRHGIALTEARRRKDLGTTWTRSLQMSDDPGLNQIGVVLQSSAELGVPCADLMKALAGSMAFQESRRFEAELKKAPVKMVVPLTVCILPAFGVLGAGPMLRGLIA